MSRRDELAANLVAVEDRITAACADAGRARDDVTLVVVTKTYPASDVDLLAELGVTDVGENRHPEAGDKWAELTHAVRRHFVGGLQTNKAGAVARYADVVQSVDRVKLARSLSRGAETAERELDCLVQVDFDGSADGRSGAVPADVPALADEVASLPGLRLGGVMTVAPLGVDPRPVFDDLVALAARLQADHPGATAVSAGMSEDFEDAVRAGATHLRVGRSILGERPALR
jgi:pyridoxal phosphate enzyme (YggS family)